MTAGRINQISLGVHGPNPGGWGWPPALSLHLLGLMVSPTRPQLGLWSLPLLCFVSVPFHHGHVSTRLRRGAGPEASAPRGGGRRPCWDPAGGWVRLPHPFCPANGDTQDNSQCRGLRLGKLGPQISHTHPWPTPLSGLGRGEGGDNRAGGPFPAASLTGWGLVDPHIHHICRQPVAACALCWPSEARP